MTITVDQWKSNLAIMYNVNPNEIIVTETANDYSATIPIKTVTTVNISANELKVTSSKVDVTPV